MFKIRGMYKYKYQFSKCVELKFLKNTLWTYYSCINANMIPLNFDTKFQKSQLYKYDSFININIMFSKLKLWNYQYEPCIKTTVMFQSLSKLNFWKVKFQTWLTHTYQYFIVTICLNDISQESIFAIWFMPNIISGNLRKLNFLKIDWCLKAWLCISSDDIFKFCQQIVSGKTIFEI